MAMAILISRPNSHPFEERKVLLTEPSKVGRSVAKSRPAPNNCIFDCKVLSRNHAIIWFENDKFFLRDTKSSNGTFVNNVRLSKGAEESEPKQLNSGDIIQFGVDVVENSKKVTHGCIIANITLYLPDGSEATRTTSTRSNVYKVNENGVPAQDIWQLSQYLQDALYREQMLENRLTALQRLISSSQTILDENSQKFAQEDKLLSRLEMLENQVEALTRNLSEDDIKRKLINLQEDRHNYEMRSKESLKRMLQEKLEAVQKLSEAERSCNSAEDECLHYKTLYEKSQIEMRELNDRHAQRLEEMKTLQEQVEKAEKRHAAVDEQASKEREDFETNMKEAREKEAAFSARAEALQAECDFAKQQLIAMKAQLDKRREGVQKASIPTKKDTDEPIEKPIDFTPRQGLQLGDEPSLFEDIPVLTNDNHMQSSSNDLRMMQAQVQSLEIEVTDKEEHVKNLREQLLETQTILKGTKEEVSSLTDKLSKAQHEVEEDKSKISKLEEQVMEYHLQAVDQLTFTDGMDQEDNGEVNELTPSSSKDSLLCSSRLQSLLDKIVEVNNLVKKRRRTLMEWTDSPDSKKAVVNEILVNSNEGHEDGSREQCTTLNHGLDFIQKIKDNFCEIERLVDSEHQGGHTIKEELKNAQAYTKDFKQQILELQDKLLEEQELTREKDEYLASLRREIGELSRERDLMLVEKNCEHQAFETAQNAAREMQKQAAKSAESAGKNKVELSAITDDNLLLKQKVQTLESELKKYRRENTRLSSDYNKLQSSYRDLELQERAQHENQIKQQANEVSNKLKSTEELTKSQELELRKDIEQEKERVSKLQSYLLSVLALVLAMILAYSLDFISISAGGRFGSS